MTSKNVTDLKRHTAEFFRRHWDPESLKEESPTWKGPYRFEGSLEDHDKQGCYAVENNGEIVYLGSGVSRGGGLYEGHGIGTRIGHILVWDRSKPRPIATRVYKPRPKWQGISAIYTIGFPTEWAYLALALEAYLISRLEPERNVVKISSGEAG